MVLPVNTESTIDAIAKMSSASAAAASGRLSDMRTMQGAAELRDYNSQTQKDLREAKGQAGISASIAEKAKTDIINSNPDLYRGYIESGMKADMEKHLMEQGADHNASLVQAFAPILEDKSPEVMKSTYSKVLAERPDLMKGLPSLEELQNDPMKADKLRLMIMSAAQTPKLREAVAADNARTANDIKLEGVKTAGNIAEAKVKYGLEAGIHKADRDSMERVAGINASSREEVAKTRADASTHAAQIRAKATGKPMKLIEAMPGGMNGVLMTVTPSVTAMLDQAGLSLDDEQKHALITDSVVEAQAEWTKQNQAFYEGKSAVTAPPVADIALNIAQTKMFDPKQSDKTGRFTSDTYESNRLLLQLTPGQLEQYNTATPSKQKQILEALKPKKAE